MIDKTKKIEESKNAEQQTPEKKNAKKAYRKPELISYGSVAELTQFGGSSGSADFFGRRV